MQSDLEKFLKVLLELLRGMLDQLGPFALVALGVILAAGIVLSIFVLRWIRRGGLRAGAAQRFFSERREVKRWLRRH
jgi:hypothetical protein